MRFTRLRDARRSENQVTRFASDSLIFFRPARCSVGSPPEINCQWLIVNCQLSCQVHGVETQFYSNNLLTLGIARINSALLSLTRKSHCVSTVRTALICAICVRIAEGVRTNPTPHKKKGRTDGSPLHGIPNAVSMLFETGENYENYGQDKRPAFDVRRGLRGFSCVTQSLVPDTSRAQFRWLPALRPCLERVLSLQTADRRGR